MQLNTIWDLDSIFEGGSESQQFKHYLSLLEQALKETTEKYQDMSERRYIESDWIDYLEHIQVIAKKMREATSYVNCLLFRNGRDPKAKELHFSIRTITASYFSMIVSMENQLNQLSPPDWESLLKNECIHPISTILEERRSLSKQKLSPELEHLIHSLSIDGYHSWSNLYQTVVSRMRIPTMNADNVTQLSISQAEVTMNNADKQTRQHLFQSYENAFEKEAEIIASSLNHIAGFRLNLYHHRKWDSFIQEPLQQNRMRIETLNTMWKVIDTNKDMLIQYLHRKAKVLGQEKLSWVDLFHSLGESSSAMTYEDAASLIISQLGQYSPNIANFTKKAFEEQWIDTEIREGKRSGGSCSHFPEKKQSRVFTSFTGTNNDIVILAHELGHAYHNYVLRDMPAMAQNIPMSLAESASTLAELMMSDAMIKSSKTKEERIVLLDEKLQKNILYLMNIQSRYIFEIKFYEERRKDLVSVERLNQLMIEAQKKAFNDSLAQYHPYFWAAKMHFYKTVSPFYNFPYTVGYLLSMGLYSKVKESGENFETRFDGFLKDTGRMSIELLAQTHLGEDLTQEHFWQTAINNIQEDILEFLDLTS